jgi:hypothetical protein
LGLGSRPIISLWREICGYLLIKNSFVKDEFTWECWGIPWFVTFFIILEVIFCSWTCSFGCYWNHFSLPFPKSELNASIKRWLFSKATHIRVATTYVRVVTSSEVPLTIGVNFWSSSPPSILFKSFLILLMVSYHLLIS